MSLPTRYLVAGAAFAVVAAAGAGAYAQAAKPEVHSEVRIVRDGDTQIIRDGRTVVMRRESHRKDAAEHLRAVLQLKPSQEPALAAYLQAQEPGKPDITVFTDDHARTTPERLATEEKMLTEHVAVMRARIAATRTFYAQLDPAQQRAFDELHEGGMMMFHRVGFGHPMPPPPIPPVPPVPGF